MQLNDAASSIAIHARSRPAEQADLIQDAPIKVIDLPLPVGRGLRKPIHPNLKPTDAKSRACTEASYRQPKVLCKVIGIEDEQAG